ncbi:MAG: hypothetical protein U0L98_01905 [Clostridia bacterium]|nr:hypothetical protein [Clostridia bacterium]
MIIVSQDKTRIYNFERISEIVVSGTEICISDNLRQEEGLVIATYETEERAKEVLNEIKEKYSEYAKISNVNGDIRQTLILPKVYKMPKE